MSGQNFAMELQDERAKTFRLLLPSLSLTTFARCEHAMRVLQAARTVAALAIVAAAYWPGMAGEMRLLDLFAGIGGFSLAAHWMGWETVAFVEKDKFCQKVLRKNFGQDIEIHDDIFDFSGEPFRGSVDIITGGFPCQPFSAAGKRKGRSDERHLFPEMLRVIREVGPRWVVAENVRGLLSIESGSVFAEVITSLESEGYEVITFCVPASAVEAPHRRDRLWIVGNRTGRIFTADCMLGESGYDAGTNSEAASSLRRHEKGDVSTGLVQSITNANHAGKGTRRSKLNAKQPPFSGERQQSQPEPCGRGADAADAPESGLSFTRLAGIGQLQTENGTGVHYRPKQQEWDASKNQWDENWLEAAARFCRVDDVVPNRVDRLKSLGNSIVPQIAFEIFKAIEEADK